MVESKTAVGVGEARGRDFTRHEGTKLHAGVRHRTSIQGENIARESAFIPRFTDKLSYAGSAARLRAVTTNKSVILFNILPTLRRVGRRGSDSKVGETWKTLYRRS